MFFIQYAQDPFIEAHQIGLEGLLMEQKDGALLFVRIFPKQRMHLPEDASLVIRTSGSTGTPQFIVHSKANLAFQAKVTFSRIAYLPDDCLAVHLPLWFAYGLSLIEICQNYSLNIICIDKKHPRDIFSILQLTQATSFDVTPNLYALMASYLTTNPSLPNNLKIRLWCCGGDILSIALSIKWQEMTMAPLLDGYGLSELGPNVALSSLAHYKLGSVGRPLQDIAISIAEDQEVLVQSPSLMLGTISADKFQFQPLQRGFFATGDLGEMDEGGYVKISGRKKNILIVNGFNISPESIEKQIAQFPYIKSVVMSSIPSKFGQKLVCALVPSQKEKFKESTFWEHCRTHLSCQDTPKRLFLLPHLPYTVNGKVDRIKLRKLLLR